MSTYFNRRGNNFRVIPPNGSAAVEYTSIKPKLYGPLSRGQSFSIIGKISRVLSQSSIISLLFFSGPSTVLFAVVSVVVDTVNGHSFGGFSHVGKEILKYSPTRVVCDASSPVIVVSRIFRIITSLSKVLPYTMNSCSAFAVRSKPRFRSSSATLTSTANGASIYISSSHFFTSSTLTFAQVVRMPSPTFSWLNDFPHSAITILMSNRSIAHSL